MEDATNEVTFRFLLVPGSDGTAYTVVDGYTGEGQIRGSVWKDGDRYRGILAMFQGTFHASDLITLRGVMERTARESAGETPRAPAPLPIPGPHKYRHLRAESAGYDVYRDKTQGRIGTIEYKDALYIGRLSEIEGEFVSPSLRDALASMAESDDRGTFFETGYCLAMQSYSATLDGQLKGWEAGIKVVMGTRETDDE